MCGSSRWARSSRGSPERVDEAQWLAFGATGQLRDGLHSARAIDFYDLKGLVEAITGRFASRSVYFDAFPPESGLLPHWLNPGARRALRGRWQHHRLLRRAASGRKRQAQAAPARLVGEIYLDRLFRQSLRQPAARELSRYQPVRRDFSLVFPDAVHWDAVGSALAAP